MTQIIESEPELQPQGGAAPPTTPKRTAVATDDSEKRPCKHCGHTKTDHLGPRCRGTMVGYAPGPTITYSAGAPLSGPIQSLQTQQCTCLKYEPKVD